MPNLSTAVDDFDDGTLNTTLWAQRIGTITESGGALHVPSAVGLLGTSRAGTNAAYTFDQVFAQVSIPALNGASIAAAEIMVTSPLNVTLAELGFSVNLVTGQMSMMSRLAGIDLTAVTITYDPVAHRWMRLRRVSSNVLWETSANGLTWTTVRTAAIPLWLSANNDIRFFAVANRNAGTVSDLLLHNFNVVPQRQIAGTVTLAATAGGTATGKATRTGAVTAAAVAGAAAAARAIRAAGAVAAATGAMTDVARRTRSAAATAAGTGSLTATPRRERNAGAAAAGTAGMSAAGRGVRGAGAGSGGSGSLTAGASAVRPGSTGLTGSSDAGGTTAVDRATQTDAHGSGGLSVPARGTRPAGAALPGSTAAAMVPGRTAAGFAAAQSSGGLSAEPGRDSSGNPVLPGTGGGSASASPVTRKTAAIAASVSALHTDATADRDPAAAAFTATGSLSGFPSGGTITDAPAPGTGGLTATPGRTAAGNVTLDAGGGLTVEGERIQATAGRGPTGGGLGASSGVVRGGKGTFPGAGDDDTFTALAVRDGAFTAAGAGGLTAAARVVRRSAAGFAGQAGMWHEGRVPVAGSGSVAVSRLSGAASVPRLSGTVVSTLGGGTAVAILQPLTLYEGNDETLTVTILPAEGESLSTVTGLEFYLKADACDDDDAAGVLHLSTQDPPGGITIVSQSADEIEATIEIPASALVDPYSRFWRLDAMTGELRRTAMYGPVTVLDL